MSTKAAKYSYMPSTFAEVDFSFDVFPLFEVILAYPTILSTLESLVPVKLQNAMHSMHYNNKCRHRWCQDEEKDLDSLRDFDSHLLTPFSYSNLDKPSWV